jgi:hypothetical protein
MTRKSDGSRERTRRALPTLGLAALCLSVVGCASMREGLGGRRLGLVTVSPDGKGFVNQRGGQIFVPWGTNYYDPNTGWAPKVWRQFDAKRVTDHFKVMSGLGVNCARVFLAAATFQPEVITIDESALQKLDTLVQIARRARIRLILTGPDHWEGSPAYWKPDRFAGEQALQALDHFWRVIGARYRGEPAILAWDLLNEPQMPWFLETWRPKWNAWLQAKYLDRDGLKAAWAGELKEDEAWGSIAAPQDRAQSGNPRLLDWQMFRESLADEWVRRQVEVLRQVDPTHLITVGYIQWSYPIVRPGEPGIYAAFNPHRQAQWLDFISIHFYQLMGQPLASRYNWDQNLAYLQTVLAYCHVGKPVVLEEYGWYGGGAAQHRQYLEEREQADWLAAEIEASRRLAGGWLSWPFADTPDSTDLSVYGGLVKADMQPKAWGLRFKAYASEVAVVPQPTPELPTLDYAAALTARMDDLPGLQEKYAQMVQAALSQTGPVPVIKERPDAAR